MSIPFKTLHLVRSLLLCFLSVVLLVFAFPKIDCGPLVWFALVPWMFALDGKRKRAAFGFSYFTGALFFFGSLYWFMYVTTVGALLLMMYLALYFGFFGLVYRYFSNQSLQLKIIGMSSAWVALEYARANILSGFGWVSLCHSQYQNWALIQIVDVTGIYGISFLIMAVNVLIKENIAFAWGRSVEQQKDIIRTNMVVLGVLIAVFAYGAWRLGTAPAMPAAKVAVVQGNIQQADKWQFENRHWIIEKYLRLSEEIMKGKPDLVIWPETAFPGFIEETPDLMERIQALARSSGVPILLGVVTEERRHYYNSALLVSAEGELGERYDKLHLVPFGEFLPLRKQLPFLTALVPIEDFSSGKQKTVFRLPVGTTEALFSVVICFEDTLAHIARGFVQNGAQMLINMTNDAWFQDSKAPFMHLQASVFRSVETRRSLVRAANTGVSCAIDPYGRVLKYVEDDHHKKTYVDGAAIFFVPLNTTQTLYTKLGDFFTYFCFLCILWAGYRVRRKGLNR